MKLLYLEDNPAARDYVCRGLGERGFEIHTSGDGQEGLASSCSTTATTSASWIWASPPWTASR